MNQLHNHAIFPFTIIQLYEGIDHGKVIVCIHSMSSSLIICKGYGPDIQPRTSGDDEISHRITLCEDNSLCD